MEDQNEYNGYTLYNQTSSSISKGKLSAGIRIFFIVVLAEKKSEYHNYQKCGEQLQNLYSVATMMITLRRHQILALQSRPSKHL